MQINGVASALRDPEVQKAFLAMPDAPVRLHVYEWAGPGSKRLLLDWTDMTSPQDLLDAAQTLEATTALRPREPGTGLGDAIEFGAEALAQQSDCWRRTLDISADGPSNTGPRPRDLIDLPILSDITINALVVGSDPGATAISTELTALQRYFQAEVIRGPQAFAIIAASYSDYQAAISRKLLRELQTFAIGILHQRSPVGDAG